MPNLQSAKSGISSRSANIVQNGGEKPPKNQPSSDNTVSLKRKRSEEALGNEFIQRMQAEANLARALEWSAFQRQLGESNRALMDNRMNEDKSPTGAGRPWEAEKSSVWTEWHE